MAFFGRLKFHSGSTVPEDQLPHPANDTRGPKILCDKRILCVLVGALCTGFIIIIAGAILVWLSLSGQLPTGEHILSSNVSQIFNESVSKRTASMTVVVKQTEIVTPAESVDYQLVVDSSGHSVLVTLGLKHVNRTDSPSPVYCDPRIEFKCDEFNCVHIKLKCNKRRDCPKGEDEINCTCVDYLSMISPQKICDGFPDCPSSDDELKCDFNCKLDEFRCLINGVCIKNERLCDDINDCADGADENQCWSLAPSIEALLDRETYQIYEYGFLFGRKKGLWFPVCVDVKISDVASADFCTKIGFKFLLSTNVKKYPIVDRTSNFLHVKSFSSESKFVSTITDTSSSCASGTVAYLACGSYNSCDSTPFCKPSTKRIVGGGSAGAFCHPWAAALYRDGELTCQAVVLTNRWLLTAAHCFTQSFNRRWTARLGFYRQYSQSSMEEVRQVVRVILHPNYTSLPVETNDIALIKMNRPVKFGHHIKPPCLPVSADERPSNGEQCTVVGWGFTDEKSSQTVDELQSVQLTVTDSTECNSTGEFKGKITDGHLCLNHGSEKKDACQGDSGGPLLCKRSGGQLYLAGVTSTGYGCARPTVPSIWTRLGYYMIWIQDVLDNQDTVAGQAVANPVCQGFGCRYGDCIYRYFQCDHQWNCLMDGDDESNCNKNLTQTTCASPRVQCNADRTCIPSYKLCDYVADCSDGEDEKFCGCDTTDVACPNGGGCAPSFYESKLKFSFNLTVIDKFC